MSKSWPSLSVVLSLGALWACGSSEQTPTTHSPELDERVLTTFFPLESLATRIAGGAVEVHCPLPEGADPQFFKPDRPTLATYQRARLVLTNGAGFERWLGTASLPPSRVVDTAAGFDEPLIEHEGMTHTHGVQGEHNHTGTDGHYWLDPLLALEQARVAARAMGEAFPDHAQAFSGHLRELEVDLEALHARLQKAVPAGTRFLAGHPAYDYLARRHDWEIRSLDLDPNTPLSGEQMALLHELVESLDPALMLWESEPLMETRTRLESELALPSVVFSPGENPSVAERSAGVTFLGIMTTNIERLESALGGD